MPDIPKKWIDLLGLIPGFDTIAMAPEGCWFDAKAADLCVEFFERFLTHTEGSFALKPFILGGWQKAKLGAVFGWKRSDGKRRFRRVFEYVPRKNGKTAFCAGLVNLCGILEGEPGARIFSIAEARAQAALIFDHTRNQLLQNPQLIGCLKRGEASIHRSYKSIEYENGIFRSLPSDAKNQHGLNPSTVIADELHAHRNRDMLDVMSTAMGAREQPLLWIITTADFDRPSVCNIEHEYACKVRDGLINDPEYLPIIFEAPREADWKDPEVWKKANPNWGVSVLPDVMEAECRRAISDPTYENTFRRLRLNQKTEQDTRLIQLDKWDAGKVEAKIEDYHGRVCYGGLDLGATSDFSAFVLAFPEFDGRSITVFPWFWLPEAPRRRDERMQNQIDLWSRDKLIERTAGNAVDISYVVERVTQICSNFQVREIAADPFMAVHAMQLLAQQGFEVIEFRQGFQTMAMPVKRMMDLLADCRFKHDGNPILRWMASNCVGERDNKDNMILSKKKSTEKIDGIICAVMALGRAMLNELAEVEVDDISSLILNYRK